MFYRLRERSSEEGGFTLIELLVVILIIGILAAIAIPSLLSQKSKAYDAEAKSLASSAQNTAETIATDNSGSYKNVTLAEIHIYEKSIPVSAKEANGGAWLSKAEETEGGQGYELQVTAPTTNDLFIITKNKEGEVKRTCKEEDAGDNACKAGTW